jgi:hypothetical protein
MTKEEEKDVTITKNHNTMVYFLYLLNNQKIKEETLKFINCSFHIIYEL